MQVITDVDDYPDWEWSIVKSCEPPDERWMAKRFIEKLREHKRRYPAFIEARVAEIFCSATTAKVRAFYCFQPMKHFTKHIHKKVSIFGLSEPIRSTPHKQISGDTP